MDDSNPDQGKLFSPPALSMLIVLVTDVRLKLNGGRWFRLAYNDDDDWYRDVVLTVGDKQGNGLEAICVTDRTDAHYK